MDEQKHVHKLNLPVTSTQASIFGGTMIAATGVDTLAHLGPTGLVIGGILAYIVAKHGPDFFKNEAGDESLPHTVKTVSQLDMFKSASGRTWKQRLLGIYPDEQDVHHDDGDEQDEPEDDETAQPKDERDNTVERARSMAAHIISPDGLVLSEDYQPHVNSVLGHCLLCVGQRGTGKSNVAARLVEQLGQYPIPMAIFDYKQDYITLPTVLRRCVIAGSPDWNERHNHRNYWALTKDNAFSAGYTIMQKGIQMVFQRISYDTIDEAAEIMLGILQGLFTWASQRPAGKRIPALVLLDEAQQFLPETRGVSDINSDLSKKLLSAFEKLNSIGRSLGLTPAFFTQRIAQIRKEVIGGSEIFWLLKQSQPRDLDVYVDLLGAENVDRRTIQSFDCGDAMVYEYGNLMVTHFYERESEHLSVTPTLEDALEFYRGKEITASLVSPNSPSQEVSIHTPTSSVERMPDLPSRESVNARVEPCETRESTVSPHSVSPSTGETESAKFTAQEAALIVKAYAALAKSGEQVNRTKIMNWLHENESTSWNNKKWAIMQAVCDEYDICPKEGR